MRTQWLFDQWNGELPTTWHGVAAIVALGFMVLWVISVGGGALIGRWHQSEYRKSQDYRACAVEDRQAIRETAEAIKGQVVNGHSSPMRADLDRVLADIAELKQGFLALIARQARWDAMLPSIEQLPGEVRGLRADLAEERESRRELAKDVREDLSRNRADMHDLDRRLRDAPG